MERFVADVVSSRKFETWGISHEHLLVALKNARVASYSAAAAAVYAAYVASTGRAGARWGDKNNFHTHHVATIREIFPDALFVHLLRDGRDVACSYKRLARKRIADRYAPKLPVEIGAIAAQWSESVRVATTALRQVDPGHVTVVKFEDLVNDTERTLLQVCSFLGEDLERSMLSYYQSNRERGLEPLAFLAWKERSLEPPNPQMAGIYKEELSSQEIRAFEAIAGSELRGAGYALDSIQG
jgi:hypothetical protein